MLHIPDKLICAKTYFEQACQFYDHTESEK